MINTPNEQIKCVQQLNRIENKSTLTVIKEIIAKKGITGLYRGFWVTFNRDVVSYGVYFLVFYSVKEFLKDHNMVSSFSIMMTGGITGIVTITKVLRAGL